MAADDMFLDTDGTRQVVEWAKEQLAEKANIDGYHEEMTVGDAEQLVSSVYVNDSVPYKFRTTGGTADVSNREYAEEIVGGTIAWNQLIQNGDFSDGTTGWTPRGINVTVSGNVLTAVPQADGGSRWLRQGGLDIKNGHKYLLSFMYNPSKTASPYVRLVKSDTTTLTNIKTFYATANTFNAFSTIFAVNDDYAYIDFMVGASGTALATDTYQYKNIVLFDLTGMFGSTIADYIYSLEQSTAGAGVAFFRSLFPDSYYAYNAGELISVGGLSAHDTVGFNQWDGVTEYTGKYFDYQTGVISNNGAWSISSKIPCLPDTTYYIKNNNTTGNVIAGFWDSNDNYLGFKLYNAGNTTFVSKPNSSYMRIEWNGTMTEMCINLSWDGERNGEYEPYQKHSYPLDSSLTLRGIPKLADGKMYYDGDIYASDGTVTRRYGIVDLGTLTWVYTTNWNGAPAFYTSDTLNANSDDGKVIAITDKFVVVTANELWAGTSLNKILAVPTNKRVYVRDSSYTDAAAFKTAMSGVYLVYELATPTEESAEPYQQIQICDDFGTEEFVSETIVPVGHETKYPANLKAKVEMAPNSPSGDGDYIVRQTGGLNTYVPVASNATISGLAAKLPNPPSENGTYTLKCTVTNGAATYSWEA